MRKLILSTSVIGLVIGIGPRNVLAQALDLQVVPQYTANSNKILITVNNGGQSIITAYSVDITVNCNNRAPEKMTFSTDLLQLVINNRLISGTSDSWTGALEPGVARTNAIDIGQNGASPTCSIAGAQVAVTGILYSNGTAAGTDSGPIKLIETQRWATVQSRDILLNILLSQSQETDITTRLANIGSEINSQLSQYSNAISRHEPSTYTVNPREFMSAAAALTAIGSSGDPEEQLNSYTSRLRAMQSLYKKEELSEQLANRAQ